MVWLQHRESSSKKHFYLVKSAIMDPHIVSNLKEVDSDQSESNLNWNVIRTLHSAINVQSKPMQFRDFEKRIYFSLVQTYIIGIRHNRLK